MRLDQPYGKRFDDDLADTEPRRKYYIACEGKKTEYQYFKGLLEAREELGISPLVEVLPINHSPGTSSHPLHIIQETKQVIDDCETYFPEVDTVCIIVDRDAKSFTPSQYDEAISVCKANAYTFVVSNPCIEIWLLFHYSNLQTYPQQEILENKKIGTRTYVERKLKDDFLNGSYNKARIQFARDFLPHVQKALENSAQYAQTIEELKTKIGSKVGLLVKELLKPDDTRDIWG